MRKSELIRLIRYQLDTGKHPRTKVVLELLDLFINQGGATLGIVTKIKELILEEK